MLFQRLIRKFILKLALMIHDVNAVVGRVTLPKFGNTPKNIRIELPRRISNPDLIYFGDNVELGPGCFLNPITSYPSPNWKNPDKPYIPQKFSPKIVIGNGVTSTAGLTIGTNSEVTIEDDVMFASNIIITDGLHGYEHANEPYKYQKMFKISPIRIKRGCWIGQNVVILPGVTVGELSIIGANSVVTKDIPDRSIAIGAPAKIIKSWDEKMQRWIKVE